MKYTGDAFIKMDSEKIESENLEKLAELENDIIGYYWVNKEKNTVDLYTLYDLVFEAFWSMIEIPEMHTIRKYSAEIKPKAWEIIIGKRKRDDREKGITRKYAVDKYGASKAERFDTKRKSKKTKYGTVWFTQLTIKIKNEQDEEVGD